MAIRWPFSSPRSARTPSTQPNTARCVSRSNQPPGARNRRVVRRVLVQRNPHKTPQRQRVRQPPRNAALRPDTLEIPDQQRAKVNPRRQRGPPVLRRLELRTPLLAKLVKALGFQQLIQLLVKRMPRRGCQLGVRDPQSLLLLPLLARAHRHRAILRTMSVDTSQLLAHVSRLAPRAARPTARNSTTGKTCWTQRNKLLMG